MPVAGSNQQRVTHRLAVVPQEVVPGQAKTADGWLTCEASRVPAPVNSAKSDLVGVLVGWSIIITGSGIASAVLDGLRTAKRETTVIRE